MRNGHLINEGFGMESFFFPWLSSAVRDNRSDKLQELEMFRRSGGRDERYSLKVDQTITYSRDWSEKSMVNATRFSPCYSES